jgi:hypothetical protein
MSEEDNRALEAQEEAEVMAAEEVAEAEGQPKGKKPKKKISKRKKLTIVAVIVVVLVAAGGGMLVWHESPSFCSTLCHIEGTYVDNYMQEQNAPGTDKYGNEVSNSNAMLAVLHRETKATAKSEIVCVDCHTPNIAELAHDGMNYVTANYPLPRNERTLSGLQSWDEKTGESFCANSGCHVYLLGDNGELDYDKLEASTAGRAFNPHEQHHAALKLECSSCHKGHRASTVVCTGCHQHENVELPDGWVDYATSQQILADAYAGVTQAA